MDKRENCLKLYLALRLLLVLLLMGNAESRVAVSVLGSFGSTMYQVSRGLLGAHKK